MEGNNFVTKQQADAQLSKLLEVETNGRCFQCSRPSKQWAEVTHAIFLCLGCAASYKQIRGTVIKSIGLDLWSADQLKALANGGNTRLSNFLMSYGLQNSSYKDKLTSKAAHFYRQVLAAEVKGQPIGEPPSPAEGREIYKGNVKFADMTAEEMLEEAKDKALWLGSKTKQLGSRAVQKISSGEFKEGTKRAAEKVGTKAKWLWGLVREKVGELRQKSPEQKNKDIL